MISFFKGPHKVLRVFITDHLADLVDCQCRVFQEQVSLLKTDLLQQLRESASEELFDIAGTVRDGVVQMGGQFLERDGGIVLLYV